MKHSKQMSESVRLGILLALSGGLMDAYSYIVRDRVFANAQTGNMLLFGVNLSEGNIRLAIHYLVPVVAFAIGIALAEYVHTRNIEKLHWRQMSVLLEAVILLGVGFIPTSFNLLANSLTSRFRWKVSARFMEMVLRLQCVLGICVPVRRIYLIISIVKIEILSVRPDCIMVLSSALY